MLSEEQKVKLLTLVKLQESDELQNCEKERLAEIINDHDDVQRGMRVGELLELNSLSAKKKETVKRFAWQVAPQRSQNEKAAAVEA